VITAFNCHISAKQQDEVLGWMMLQVGDRVVDTRKHCIRTRPRGHVGGVDLNLTSRHLEKHKLEPVRIIEMKAELSIARLLQWGRSFVQEKGVLLVLAGCGGVT
jgi:hypothetical protein